VRCIRFGAAVAPLVLPHWIETIGMRARSERQSEQHERNDDDANERDEPGRKGTLQHVD
jgi:hypothetical protein